MGVLSLRCRSLMNRERRTLFVSVAVVAMVATTGYAQAPQGGRSAVPPAGARAGGPAPLLQARPRPLIANATPVRSCDSLSTVVLPNTTIESAAVDPANPELGRVVATTTHPPAGDKVRIWIAIPTANWNGRFL